MDVNLSADGKVKSVGMPAQPTVTQEDRDRAAVRPVQPGTESTKGNLDEKTLQGRRSDRSGGAQEMSRDELDKYVEEIQDRFDAMGTRLGFTVNDEPEAVVVEVKDRETGKVVRQIPSEEVLALREKLQDLVGILFEGEA